MSISLKVLIEAVNNSQRVLNNAPYWLKAEAQRVHDYNLARLEAYKK